MGPYNDEDECVLLCN